jgi:hypothetical protein
MTAPLIWNEPLGPEPEYEGKEIRNSSMCDVFSKNSEGKGRNGVGSLVLRGRGGATISHSKCTPVWIFRASSTLLVGLDAIWR